MSNLPPNQQLVARDKWPVVGERTPRADSSSWQLHVSGLVARPTTWDLKDLQQQKQVTQEIDIHCVTRWSKPGVSFSGLLLSEVLEQVGLSRQQVEEMYRYMAIANYEDRFVIPTTHREYAENAYDVRGSCGFSFGNGCSDGQSDTSLFGGKSARHKHRVIPIKTND